MDESSLERYLDFSDVDLASNRTGRLSPGQLARMRWSGIWRLVLGPPVLVGAVVVALVVDNALFAVFVLGLAGLGLYITWRGFAFFVDAVDGVVAYVTGRVGNRVVHGKYGDTYYASIGPVSKRITFVSYESLPVGQSCHLYYAPGCRSLLSVEPAAADEPKPAHPFGPDSVHAWDRLRWSWVLMTIGALGALVGAHAIATAHPADPVEVGGIIADYVETHGKTTTRSLYLTGHSIGYTPQSEDTYSPPAPPFDSLIGKEVLLYVDQGTSNVIALNDGELLHAADWYAHPEDERSNLIWNGTATGAASLFAFLVGLALLVFGSRLSARMAPKDLPARPALYAPPTVRPLQATVPAAVLAAAVVVASVFFLVLIALR